MTAALETLLRDNPMVRGCIQLSRLDEGWTCTIAHQQAHMTHSLGRTYGDPVDALRSALIEDDRMARDLARRYREAPRADPAQIDIEDAIKAATADDFEGLL